MCSYCLFQFYAAFDQLTCQIEPFARKPNKIKDIPWASKRNLALFTVFRPLTRN